MKVIIIGATSHGKGAIKKLLEGLDKLDYPLQTEIENLSYARLSLPEAGFTLKPGSTIPVEFKSFAVLSRSLSSLSAIAYMNRNDGLAKVHIEAAEGEEEVAAKAAEAAAAKEKAEKEEQAKAAKAAEEARAAEKAAAEKAEKEKAEKAKADKAKADADAKAAAKAKAAEEAAAAKAAAAPASEAGDTKAEDGEPAAKAAE